MEFSVTGLTASQRYKLLIGGIVPRPIAFVSTVSISGQSNLAPFSFFAGVCSDPMTLLFCPANAADGGEKDTLRNAAPPAEGGTGEFVVNVAVEAYANRVAAAAEPLPSSRSEFDFIELTRADAAMVKPPRVAESPVAYECRTIQVIRLNPGAPAGGNIVIGEVVHVFVRDDLIDDRLRIDADALRAIGRMGGLSYCRTRDRFEMSVGSAALEK
ncbi:MAG: flavin reductase family protein [Planctomycetes bacterium]|nr:flavin reductase family protein [Planctomycetota bacterium]